MAKVHCSEPDKALVNGHSFANFSAYSTSKSVPNKRRARRYDLSTIKANFDKRFIDWTNQLKKCLQKGTPGCTDIRLSWKTSQRCPPLTESDAQKRWVIIIDRYAQYSPTKNAFVSERLIYLKKVEFESIINLVVLDQAFCLYTFLQVA